MQLRHTPEGAGVSPERIKLVVDLACGYAAVGIAWASQAEFRAGKGPGIAPQLATEFSR